MAALGYFYMVSAWGGYIFIINIIPIHVFALLVTGRYSHRVYVAYCSFYVMATLLSMQIPFVGFLPVRSSEHVAAFGVFGLLQLYGGLNWLRSIFPPTIQRELFRKALFALIGGGFVILVFLRMFGYVSSWTGRFYSLLDPTYAKDHIPIIASVSEHQPTTWSSYFFDLHILTFLFPAGLFFLFKRPTDQGVFLILYGITSVYFSGVMVRLMLVLSPAACVLSSIAVTETFETYFGVINGNTPTKSKKKGEDESGSVPKEVAWALVAGLTLLLCAYQLHCSWVTAEAYSSPSIVLSARGNILASGDSLAHHCDLTC